MFQLLGKDDESIDSSENFDELLEESEQADDDFEFIIKIISAVLGVNYYGIGKDGQMFRYVMLPIEKNQSEALPAKKGF